MDAPSQLVAITFADGSVGIMQFLLEIRLSPIGPGVIRQPTTQAIQQEIDKSSFDQPVVSWRALTSGPARGHPEIPTDRSYRNAWVDGGSGVGIRHDMVKARNLHRDVLRLRRAARLVALDIEEFRALRRRVTGITATNIEITDVAQRKQLLLDAPQDPRIDAAATVDDLKIIDLPAT